MKKILTHWTTAFITLFVLTYIGLQDPSGKEILRLKSFDYLLANEEKTSSKDITIITIDEEAIEKYGAVKGSLLAGWRILRCNPFSKGGYDPVP